MPKATGSRDVPETTCVGDGDRLLLTLVLEPIQNFKIAKSSFDIP